jgi:hypothetical protein
LKEKKTTAVITTDFEPCRTNIAAGQGLHTDVTGL